MEKIIVTRDTIGICYMQVCAEKNSTDEEILEIANIKNPSGTTNGWSQVIRQQNENSQGPVQCEKYPDRFHFIVVC